MLLLLDNMFIEVLNQGVLEIKWLQLHPKGPPNIQPPFTMLSRTQYSVIAILNNGYWCLHCSKFEENQVSAGRLSKNWARISAASTPHWPCFRRPPNGPEWVRTHLKTSDNVRKLRKTFKKSLRSWDKSGWKELIIRQGPYVEKAHFGGLADLKLIPNWL